MRDDGVTLFSDNWVTRLVEAQEELESVREQYYELYHFGPVGYVNFDASAIILDANDAFCKLLGLRRELLTGLPITSVVAPAHFTAVLDHLRRCRRADSGKIVSDVEFRHSAGHALPVELITAAPLHDKRVFQTAVVDRSERIKADQASRLARELAENVVECIPHPLLVLNADLRVLNVNGTFCQKFRTNGQEIVGCSLYDLPCLTFTSELTEHLNRIFATGHALDELETSATERPSARPLRLLLSGRRLPVIPHKPRMVVLALQDVTARKAAQDRNEELLTALQASSHALEMRVHERTRQLADANSRLQELSGKIVEAQENERRRISRELHDDIGQELTAVKMSLVNVRAKVPAQLQPLFDEAAQSVGGLLDTIRRMAVDLRPPALDDIGLVPALEGQIKSFSTRTGVKVTLNSTQLDERRLSPAHKTALFRIAQEALTNIARHSGATRGRVSLRQGPTHVTLTITDAGKGFQREEGGTLGLAGMRERAAYLDGEFEVKSSPGKGTRVEVKLPITTEQN